MSQHKDVPGLSTTGNKAAQTETRPDTGLIWTIIVTQTMLRFRCIARLFARIFARSLQSGWHHSANGYWSGPQTPENAIIGSRARTMLNKTTHLEVLKCEMRFAHYRLLVCDVLPRARVSSLSWFAQQANDVKCVKHQDLSDTRIYPTLKIKKKSIC